MDLILLKAKHKYEANYEEVGIFSSMENMRRGKEEYLKNVPLPPDEYTFTHLHMKLDEIY